MDNHVEYIGCMNDWSARVWRLSDGTTHVEKPDTTPVEYSRCIQAGHATVETKRGHCWYAVRCPICGISWDYDCSD